MNADGRTTSEQLYIPTLLVVGAGEALVVRCYYAAKSTGLATRRCEVEEAAITVPRRHPLCIVVPNDVFDTAAPELSALARDVRSVLIPVDPQVSVRELEAMIAGAIDGGLSQRERQVGAGRYSIVDGVEEEAPFSRRSSPPSLSPGLASTRRSSVPGPLSVRPSPVPGPVSVRPSPAPGPVSVRPSPVPGPVSVRPSPPSGPLGIALAHCDEPGRSLQGPGTLVAGGQRTSQ